MDPTVPTFDPHQSMHSSYYNTGEPAPPPQPSGGIPPNYSYDESYPDPSSGFVNSNYYPKDQSSVGDAYYASPEHLAQTADPALQTYKHAEWSTGALSAEEAQSEAVLMTEPGFYYPVSIFQAHSVGDPIIAIGYDEMYEAIYLATPSQSLSTGGGTRHTSSYKENKKASMLLTHSTVDHSLYASVAGHPEAPPDVLNSIYQTIFGCSPPNVALPTTDVQSKSRQIPSHAYRPSYGSLDPAVPSTSYATRKSSYQLGICNLIPLAGFVASVSPSGVRLHQSGGFMEADRHIEGMLCGTPHPTGISGGMDEAARMTTHVTVGGRALPKSNTNDKKNHQPYHLECLDLWQGLRPVASSTLRPVNSSGSTNGLAVTALVAIHNNGSMVAGCTDGYIRLLDGRLREMAKVKSHAGGVLDVAASRDGALIATTGFSSRGASGTSALYGFIDPSILVYDIRYLGRGGIPHPFAGMRGAPRFLSFIPDAGGQPSNRLVAASGQVGGGLQIIVPFQEALDNPAGYMLPALDRGASITSMCVCEDNLALGTSQGTVLQYRLAGNGSESDSITTKNSNLVPSGVLTQRMSPGVVTGSVPSKLDENRLRKLRLVLALPSYQPRPPALSLDASLLSSEDKDVRPGLTDQIKNIFSSYVLSRDPTVSVANKSSVSSFGRLVSHPMIPPSRLEVSPSLLSKSSHSEDFLRTIPTSALNVNVLEDHRSEQAKGRHDKKPIQLNPNKFLNADKLFPLCYEASLNRSKKIGRRWRGDQSSTCGGCNEVADSVEIPTRYRLLIRPTYKSASSFNHYEYNETGFLPGWDYPPSMPNAFVPPVLMVLYSVPELRSSAMSDTFEPKSLTAKGILPDLAFLFHRIDSLGRFSLIPTNSGNKQKPCVGAWAPTNFISSLASMPEAEQLQILDGSPAAVDPPRRPEAFYRFLLYQIDKEVGPDNGPNQSVDSTGGMTFVSVNGFISGSDRPSHTTTRALTVDLYYEGLLKSKGGESPDGVRFCDILQGTLCREARLRAWSQGSKSYETIVQRKVATSLPQLLSISCACAGRKEEEGLSFWRGSGSNNENFLPELIEIELDGMGRVVVRQFIPGEGSWCECSGGDSISSFPPAVVDIVSNLTNDGAFRKRRYRLDAVLSIVRDDYDRSAPEVIQLVEEGRLGHLVLHARIPASFKRRMLEEQVREAENVTEAPTSDSLSMWSDPGESWSKRLAAAKSSLESLKEDATDTEWVLVNGFVVSKTVLEDATAFHVKFKEPSLVVYRAVDVASSEIRPLDTFTLPLDVMKTASLTNGSKSLLASNQRPSALPGRGDLVAFDAEFVSVQEEESTLTETGSKVVVRETRYAVARISIIDCMDGTIIMDEYVQPREPVVDYLTRFSGIAPKDLDPKQSSHHLITTRSAYLKLRHLLERGCVFVGHGLQQDFWTVNLAVPPSQIIDTLEIYHKPAQRYISLRFLTNFVLKRDMQQEVHDSVEDAMAAYELYRKSVELKGNGTFEQLLDELYEYGQKNDWKLGVDDSDYTG